MAVGREIFAWFFTASIGMGIGWAFRSHGAAGVSLLLLFLAALVTTQLSVHWLVQSLGFPYPSFLTLLQFLSLWLTSTLLCGARASTVLEADGVTMMRMWSRRFCSFYSRTVLPVAATHALATVANNASLQLIGPGFNAILGAMTPACTGILSAMCGSPIHREAGMALIMVSIGGCFTLQGGISALTDGTMNLSSERSGSAWFGITCSFVAMLLRAVKAVTVELAMRQPRKADNVTSLAFPSLSPVQLLMLQTPTIVVVLTVVAGMDQPGLQTPTYRLLQALSDSDDIPLLCGLLLNLASANVLNLLGLFAIKMVGATATQICGKCNVFVIMALSAAYAGEQIPGEEIVGAILILGSASLYSASMRKTSMVPVAQAETSAAPTRGQVAEP